ncbi:MAG: hypothetical protein ABI779_05490 [Acidobacteriota bacterium]
MTLAVFYVCLASMIVAQQKAAAGERLVPMPPCRLVDTRVTAAKDASEESRRRVQVAADRCGKIVPTVATAYAIRVNLHDRTVGNVPPAARAPSPVLRFPVGAPIDFPVGATEHIAVDLEGYYVPADAITDPGPSSTSAVKGEPDKAATESGTESALRPSIPRSDANPTGPYGDVYLDGSIYPATGVLAVASALKPWTILKAGDSGGGGGFAVFNSNHTELLRLASNGPLRLTTNTYFSGRSDYREVVSPLDNVFTQIKVVNPRDAAGGSTNRVTFFNARSDDEVGSPATTKFQAFTMGYYNQIDVNFDSQIWYHFPQYTKYHFRAYSNVEQKETFWVKAATNFDGISQTRADMYVSGNVGIGKIAAADVKLDVQGNLKVSGAITGATVIGAMYQDLAEWVPASSDMMPGTVVILNPEAGNEVMPSLGEYDVRVAGVVSEQPGIILGIAGDAKEQIATTGRVRVKVDASAAPIRVGDLLVTSDKPGRAMRSEAIEIQGRKFHQPGTIIGKALEPLSGGEGEILVLLSLQ